MRCVIDRLYVFDPLVGRYVYTGSAKRNLYARIARHLRQENALRWYLDFLLTAPGVGVQNNGRKSGPQFVHERPQTALGGGDALRALKAGEIDAALYVGGAATPTIQQALRDSVIGARAHYARLQQLTAQREVERPELIRAKAFLASR